MSRDTVRPSNVLQTPWPAGMVAWWLGGHGTWPQWWEYADGSTAGNGLGKPDLRGRYIKGVPPGGQVLASGGADTHTHSVGAHQHEALDPGGLDYDYPGRDWITHNHSHNSPPVSGGALTDPGSNDPNHALAHPIVFCPPLGRGKVRLRDFASDALPPLGAVFAWGSVTANLPDGYAVCDGGTYNGIRLPDLRGKFLKGVPAGQSIGQVNNTGHQHIMPHSHHLLRTPGGYDHPTDPINNWWWGDHGDVLVALAGHDHQSTTDNAPSSATIPEPLHITVSLVAFVGLGIYSGRGIIRSADIIPTLRLGRGIVIGQSVPNQSAPGFRVCDGGNWQNGSPNGYGGSCPDLRGRFLKHTNTGEAAGQLVDSGSHSHTGGGAHNHNGISGGTDALNAGRGDNLGQSKYPMLVSHTHVIEMAGGAFQNATVEPPSVTVSWLVRD